VAHIGEELRLVLARPRERVGLLDQLALGMGELVALLFERPGLRLELSVGLLELSQMATLKAGLPLVFSKRFM
jgi:hypothetical protein